MKYGNLLLISGSGRNSGKTALACRLIEQLSSIGIISVKISPHFHSSKGDSEILFRTAGYEIYEERSAGTDKDTSRMLRSGARKAIYIQASDSFLEDSFLKVYSLIPESNAVVCESPALIRFIEPGMFVYMESSVNNPKGKASWLRDPDLVFRYEDLGNISMLPIDFVSGQWSLLY